MTLIIKVYPSNEDLSKTWFIQYSNPEPGKKPLKRYISSQKFPSLNERRAEAERIISEIKAEWQPAGNTFHPDLLKDLYAVIELRVMGKRRKTADSYWAFYHGFREWYMQTGRKTEKQMVGVYFMKSLLLAKKKNNTHNNYKRSLRSFFADLLQYYPQKYTSNPFDSIRSLPERSATKQYFKPHEQQRVKAAILDNNDHQLWIGCLLLYYCFIRPAEQKELRICNINFETKKIQIAGTSAKNSTTAYVPMPGQLVELLLPYKNMPGNWYLLGNTGCPGESKLGRDTLSKRHAKILKQLGFPKNYTYYSWKNTGAVELVKKGTHMKTISMLMRHSGIDVTDVYLKSLGISDLIEQMMISYTEI